MATLVDTLGELAAAGDEIEEKGLTKRTVSDDAMTGHTHVQERERTVQVVGTIRFKKEWSRSTHVQNVPFL